MICTEEEAERLIGEGKLKPLYKVNDGVKTFLVHDQVERLILYNEQLLGVENESALG